MECYFDANEEKDTTEYEATYKIGDQINRVPIFMTRTNNQAEYQSLILLLEDLIELTGKPGFPSNNIVIYGDSELIINQVRGVYKVKNQGLVPFNSRAVQLVRNLAAQHCTVSLVHIPRKQNNKALNLKD